jgi:hypothetical protein
VNFIGRLLKSPHITDFTKSRPVGAEMFHAGGRADGRTDMTKLIVTFCNFANAPKNPYFETRSFITLFTLACHGILLCNRWNQPASSHSVHISITISTSLQWSIRIFQTKRYTRSSHAQHWTRSWTWLIYTTLSYPIFLRAILILSSHLCLGIPVSLPFTLYDQNVPCSHRLSTCVLHAPSISSSLICSQ